MLVRYVPRCVPRMGVKLKPLRPATAPRASQSFYDEDPAGALG